MISSSHVTPLLALLLGTASAIPAPQEFPPPALPGDGSWDLKQFTSLVAFGDSYTDESRLAYFISTGGQAPPVGWIGPESNATSTGGRIWPRYVSDYTGANLYDYAVSGAVCSNRQVDRYLEQINGSFPDVEGYEIPAFLADKAFTGNGTNSVLSIPNDETVYSMWIGTNDLGGNAFLTESQAPGLTIVDYINCVYDQFDTLYENGARYFVLMNLAPLQLAPVYATAERGGVGEYLNVTETSYRMKEQVNLANDVYKYQTPYEQKISNRYPDAHFAIFDMYSLLTDIYINPANYLNGTAPLNVESYITADTALSLTDRDSYMWYDALHPSEQTDRVIAANFVDVVKGTSKWATYW